MQRRSSMAAPAAVALLWPSGAVQAEAGAGSRSCPVARRAAVAALYWERGSFIGRRFASVSSMWRAVQRQKGALNMSRGLQVQEGGMGLSPRAPPYKGSAPPRPLADGSVHISRKPVIE